MLIDKQQIIAELNLTMLLFICHASAPIYVAMTSQSFNYGVLPHLISSPNLELPIELISSAIVDEIYEVRGNLIEDWTDPEVYCSNITSLDLY